MLGRATPRSATGGGREAREGALVALAGVEKVYTSGRLAHVALRGVDLTVDRGDLVAIVGPSGSGKSTILNMVTGIDRPTAGRVRVGGRRIDEMTEDELAAWRGGHVGIVFQFFQLLPMLTAHENATLPFDLAGRDRPRDARERARRNLELVGLGDKLDHLPAELSGGEQQRVAIARALAREPELIVADEPTGNLDSAAAANVLELLMALNRNGATVILVTHDPAVASRAHRTVSLCDGRVVNGKVEP
jgi:putative ABC transport system ATP-binding protein